MKKLLTALCLCCMLGVYAQNQVTFIEPLYDQPMAEVAVYDENKNLLGYTNNLGQITLDEKVQWVQIDEPQYPPQTHAITQSPMTITIQTELVELQTIVATGNDPLAKNLIKEVIKNQPFNSPKSLESYQFSAYTKFWADAQKDEIPLVENPENEQDSTQNRWLKVLDKSMFAFAERAMEYDYHKQYGAKNRVVASRISGAVSPLFEFVAMQPISHEFEEDEFNFFFRKFTNPVSKAGLEEYNYYISDTVVLQGRRMVVVGFKSKEKKRFLHGILKIDEQSKALAEFYAENRTSGDSDTYIEVVYTPQHNVWIPKRQYFRTENQEGFGFQSVRDSITPEGVAVKDTVRNFAKSWVNVLTQFNDFKTPVAFKRKDFRGYEDEVEGDAFADFDQKIQPYRTDTLSARERNTYATIDSVAREFKVDKKMKWLRFLTSGGYYSIGKIDLNANELFSANDYEGIRLGMGLRTNYRFHENLTLYGRVNYGTKDQKFKYGLGASYLVNKPNSGKILVEYEDDIQAAGRFTSPILTFPERVSQVIYNSTNPYYYDYQRGYLGYQQDAFQHFTFRLGAERTNAQSLFSYRYNGLAQDHLFQMFSTPLTLRWLPNYKYVRTPYGKVTLQSDWPILTLSADKNWRTLGGDFSFLRLDAEFHHKFKTLGKTSQLILRAGKLWGDAPIWKNFDGGGTGRRGESIGNRWSVGGLNGFETMAPGEFVTDEFAYFQWRQFLFKLKLFNRTTPITGVYRGGIGNMRTPELHQDFDFQVMNKYYQEGGLEADGILLGIFGIGAYYRLGEYAFGEVNKDLTLKVTAKLRF